MAARAQEISQEAGSKIAGAMKDVIGAAAGLSGFAIESARDLIQFMVRRGSMAQAEADKLLHEVEEAHGRRKPAVAAKPAGTVTVDARKPAPKPAASAAPGAHAHAHATAPVKPAATKPAAPRAQVVKPVKPVKPAKPAVKAAGHPAPKPKAAAKTKPARAARPAAKKKKKR